MSPVSSSSSAIPHAHFFSVLHCQRPDIVVFPFNTSAAHYTHSSTPFAMAGLEEFPGLYPFNPDEQEPFFDEEALNAVDPFDGMAPDDEAIIRGMMRDEIPMGRLGPGPGFVGPPRGAFGPRGVLYAATGYPNGRAVNPFGPGGHLFGPGACAGPFRPVLPGPFDFDADVCPIHGPMYSDWQPGGFAGGMGGWQRDPYAHRGYGGRPRIPVVPVGRPIRRPHPEGLLQTRRPRPEGPFRVHGPLDPRDRALGEREERADMARRGLLLEGPRADGGRPGRLADIPDIEDIGDRLDEFQLSRRMEMRNRQYDPPEARRL